jgi:hypothetical protein
MGGPGSVAVTSETLGAGQHNDPVAHDRRSRDDGHILIGGTGRAGTTVLVQYFTVLGFDTGYTIEEAMARVDPISRGGLEHSLGRGNLAYVSKSPWFGNHLGVRLEGNELAVRWMIVPIRELHAAAESRREVSRRAEESGRDPHSQPGGLSFGAKGKPKQQEQRLGVQLYRLVHTLARYGVPTLLLPFPEFARDHGVLLHRLGPLLEEHGVSADESLAAYERVVDASHITDYPAADPP